MFFFHCHPASPIFFSICSRKSPRSKSSVPNQQCVLDGVCWGQSGNNLLKTKLASYFEIWNFQKYTFFVPVFPEKYQGSLYCQLNNALLRGNQPNLHKFTTHYILALFDVPPKIGPHWMIPTKSVMLLVDASWAFHRFAQLWSAQCLLIKFRWCDVVKMLIAVPPACFVFERNQTDLNPSVFGCKVQPLDDVSPYYPSTTPGLWLQMRQLGAAQERRHHMWHRLLQNAGSKKGFAVLQFSGIPRVIWFLATGWCKEAQLRGWF